MRAAREAVAATGVALIATLLVAYTTIRDLASRLRAIEKKQRLHDTTLSYLAQKLEEVRVAQQQQQHAASSSSSRPALSPAPTPAQPPPIVTNLARLSPLPAAARPAAPSYTSSLSTDGEGGGYRTAEEEDLDDGGSERALPPPRCRRRAAGGRRLQQLCRCERWLGGRVVLRERGGRRRRAHPLRLLALSGYALGGCSSAAPFGGGSRCRRGG